jgi:hypothetical protein
VGYRRNGRGIKGIKREGASYCAEETVIGVVNARKKMALAGGSHLSAGEGRKMGTSSGLTGMGRGLVPPTGPKGSPGSNFIFFFLFFFFLFLFSKSFVSFAKMLQIKPNQFHKFCRIHSKVLN